MTNKPNKQLPTVKNILQEEIADRVWYESRGCELQLKKGLKRAEKRLSDLLHQAQLEADKRVEEERKKTYMSELPKELQKQIKQLVKIAVNWGADENQSYGMRSLESDIIESLTEFWVNTKHKALKAQREELINELEWMRERQTNPRPSKFRGLSATSCYNQALDQAIKLIRNSDNT